MAQVVSRTAAVSILRLAAAIATIGVVSAVAITLWVTPGPVDAVTAFAAAAAWTSWLDHQDQA